MDWNTPFGSKVNVAVHGCTVSMLLWKEPGEQRWGFFFG
jgi:hypothetical protein